jgi:hypothetical protein
MANGQVVCLRLALLLGAVLCLVSVTEAMRFKRNPNEFPYIDKNNDNKLSRAEFMAYADEIYQSRGRGARMTSEVRTAIGGLFSDADTNNDGYMSRQEYDDWNP